MENKKKNYYEITKYAKPHMNVEKFIDLKIEPQKAIDLGCGAGRDTVYLLKNNWQVTAIDKEDTSGIIKEQLDKEQLKNFKFIKANFSKIMIEETNLIVANFSLSFCEKEYFQEFWSNLTKAIIKDGYFVGNFFGKNDTWANDKKDMVFFDKDEVIELFKNFKIIEIKEIEKEGKTANGNLKYWHIFDVIAKKCKRE